MKILALALLSLIFATGCTSALLTATKNHDVNRVRDELNKPFDQTTASEAIHEASSKGYADIVKLLLERGVKADQKLHGDTPLMTAARNNRTEVVRLLLSHDADINAKDSFGRTPLLLALQWSQKDVSSMLILNGADGNPEAHMGTALSLAAENGFIELAEILIKRGADLNVARYFDGLTPWELALKNKKTDLARLLAYSGADIKLEDAKGSSTILDAAISGNTGDLIDKCRSGTVIPKYPLLILPEKPPIVVILDNRLGKDGSTVLEAARVRAIAAGRHEVWLRYHTSESPRKEGKPIVLFFTASAGHIYHLQYKVEPGGKKYYAWVDDVVCPAN